MKILRQIWGSFVIALAWLFLLISLIDAWAVYMKVAGIFPPYLGGARMDVRVTACHVIISAILAFAFWRGGIHLVSSASKTEKGSPPAT